MQWRDFFDHFEAISEAPEGVDRLRELVLELAVRGKLVPQDPEDEPASVLLERIEAERSSLEKAGKIRKQNRIPSIEPGKELYDLPSAWTWDRLGNYLYIEMGQSPPSKYYNTVGAGLPFYQGKADFGTLYPEPSTWCTKPSKTALEGDVLISVRAPVGPTNLCREDSCIGRGLAALRPLAGTSPSYLLITLRALEESLVGAATGTTFAAITKKNLQSFTIPIPPLAEQHRIVARVDELMGLCDELEAKQSNRASIRNNLRDASLNALATAETTEELARAWKRVRENFAELVHGPDDVDGLRQAILQLGVRGRLVPQDPNDEPATELVKRLQARQHAKNRDLDLEGPFDLPENWTWTRLYVLGAFGRGKSQHRPRNDPSLFENGIYPFIQTGDIAQADGIIATYGSMYNEKGLAQSKLWPRGTLCITIAANIAATAILDMDACFPDSIVGLHIDEEIGDARFFDYVLRLARQRLETFAPATAQKNINLTILRQLSIPLPPLLELRRIVTKLNQLLHACDELEAQLAEQQKTAEALGTVAVQALTG